MSAYAGEHARAEVVYVATAPGVRLRCVRFTPRRCEPAAPALVFVAGWISLLNTWRHFLPELAREVPILYVESREKSTSQVTGSAAYGIQSMAADLAAVLEESAGPAGTYVLAGSSMGATTVLEALPVLPRRPEALALILPNASFDLPGYARVLRVIPHALLPQLKGLARRVMLRTRIDPNDLGQQERFLAALSAADAVKLKESALAARRYRLDPSTLHPPPFPCLVIGAARDRQHDQAAVREIASRLEADYVDLETFTASHSSEAARAILTFLRRHGLVATCRRDA